MSKFAGIWEHCTPCWANPVWAIFARVYVDCGCVRSTNMSMTYIFVRWQKVFADLLIRGVCHLKLPNANSDSRKFRFQIPHCDDNGVLTSWLNSSLFFSMHSLSIDMIFNQMFYDSIHFFLLLGFFSVCIFNRYFIPCSVFLNLLCLIANFAWFY